jgi:uncharacterized protein (TIGR00369 family)
MAKPDDLMDRFPHSQTSRLLGQTMIDFDRAKGWVRLSFVGKDAFQNPAGFIQGGILTAMLDDTMGPALWVMTNGEAFPTTIDLNVSFLTAARPGPLYGEGKVIQLGKTIAFVEAQLTDADNTIIARSTATARMAKINLPTREASSETKMTSDNAGSGTSTESATAVA